MPGVSTYKREDVVISVESLFGGGSYIVEGYADGDFCTITPEGDGYTRTSGSHQTTTRNRMDLPGGMISLVLHGSSPSNRDLYELWKLDKDTGSHLFAITVRDIRSGGKLAYSEAAFIKQVPELTFGDEISDVTWEIECMQLQIEHAGQLSALPA
jgi:hypothetical protein